MKNGKHPKMIWMFLAVILLSSYPTRACTIDLYAMCAQNNNIYKINTKTGKVKTVSTKAQFPSIGIASDGRYLYYWNADTVTQRGIAKWDFLTDTHVMIDSVDISEENAGSDPGGTLWLLDRTNSYDPTLKDGKGGFLGDDTGHLYEFDISTQTRTIYATLPDVGGYAAGDIAWGPDKKLYISTHNTFWGYDSVDNYVWDPSSGKIQEMGGVYHAGLTWIGDKLYGSRTLRYSPTSAIFELNPADFSEIRQVAIMPNGVYIGDLAPGVIPEPATISLLSFGALLLLRRKVVNKQS
ncbi:MAG: PEP-CTERM sorting domain-containing protein [Planctomycetota bacterium]|jgi:hypothetical protein